MGEFALQNEALNYPKCVVVYLTGRWRESLRSYPGRSDQPLPKREAPLEGTRICSDIYLVHQKSAEAIVPFLFKGRAEH